VFDEIDVDTDAEAEAINQIPKPTSLGLTERCGVGANNLVEKFLTECSKIASGAGREGNDGQVGVQVSLRDLQLVVLVQRC